MRGLQRIVLQNGQILRGHSCFFNGNGCEMFFDVRTNHAWAINPDGTATPMEHLPIDMVFRLMVIIQIGDERYVWPKITPSKNTCVA
jgi:hypothetical protein